MNELETYEWKLLIAAGGTAMHTTDTENYLDTHLSLMPKDRYLLIDDDPVYRAIAEATAGKMGVELLYI